VTKRHLLYACAFAAGVLWRSCSPAYAIGLRSGSWEYPDAEYLDRSLKRDGQCVMFTGGRGLTFKGIIYDYWDEINTKDCAVRCGPGKRPVNWYSGTGDGRNHKGVGLLGTLMLGGVEYLIDGVTNRLQIFTYGTLREPKLGRDGQRKVKTLLAPLVGSFEHDDMFTPISGTVVVTVELVQEMGKWIVETISYDVVRQ
jgi:hypothetical protein